VEPSASVNALSDQPSLVRDRINLIRIRL
jgi:hypothetical protein